MVYEYVVVGVLILLSGFFSGAETALFSLSELKIRHMVEQGKKGAKLVQKLKNNPHKLLTTLLVYNNMVNISASALATVIAVELFGSIGPGVATGAMTLLILVFGEITPKSLAVQHNEIVSTLVVRPLWFLAILLFPIIYIFELLSRKITSFFESDKKRPALSQEELKTILALGEEEGAIGKEEKEMIHGVLKLDDKSVYQIMTPRNEVFSVDMNKKVNDVLGKILKSGFSRIPVYDKKVTSVKGVVYIKDIMNVLHQNKDPKIKNIMKEPFIVPELKKVDDLLTEFKKRKVHIALVVDEHGDTSGLITIEDLLEEIVGEIYDETDKEEVLIKKVNDKTFILSGKADIEDVALETGISLKEIDITGFETVNGLINYKTGKIPQKGEKIQFKKFYLEVMAHNQNKVIKAKLVKKI